MVLYNVELFDQKLSYSIKQPYNDLRKLNNLRNNTDDNTNWCSAVNSLITAATDLEDSVLLKELVTDFQLSGSLLAA
jgi:hypothetical protein